MTDPQSPHTDDWAGARGDKWLRDLDLMEAMLAPVGADLLATAAPRPGQRLVDIGCGGGWTSRQAANAVGPGGHVLGLDISAALVAEATRRAAHLPQLAFRAADAATDTPPGAPFDMLISRFGVMFFADPATAWRRLATLVRPGGEVHVAVWADPRRNPWMMEMRRVLGAHITLPTQDPHDPGPFQLADPAFFDPILAGAGLTGVTRRLVEQPLLLGGAGATPATAAAFALRAFALGDILAAAGPAIAAAGRADLEALYAAHQTDAGVALNGCYWLVSAHRP